VRRSAITRSRPRARWCARWGRGGGRNRSGSSCAAWRQLGDDVGQDEASGSSPWCSVVGEAEEGFRATVFSYGGGAPMPGGELRHVLWMKVRVGRSIDDTSHRKVELTEGERRRRRRLEIRRGTGDSSGRTQTHGRRWRRRSLRTIWMREDGVGVSEKPNGQFLGLIVMSHWHVEVWIRIWDISVVLRNYLGWCEELRLLVSWCVGDRCDIVDSDDDHSRSRKPDAEDRWWLTTDQILDDRTIGRSDDVLCGLHHAHEDEECGLLSKASKPRSIVCQ
jgi:hypothetical protein